MDPYLETTQESGAAFVRRRIDGPVVMLNLLRFRDTADYSAAPELAPDEPITGAAAYRRYAEHTAPFLEEAGGEVLFKGTGGHVLIGPPDERWDLVLLVQRQGRGAPDQSRPRHQTRRVMGIGWRARVAVDLGAVATVHP
jgi:hypothetical protein